MNRVLVKDLGKYVDQPVKVQGWVQTVRDQKTMQFVILRDRTGLVQVAVDRGADRALADAVSGITRESAATVRGTVLADPRVNLGGLEIRAEEIAVEGEAQSPLPIDPFGATDPDLEHRLDWRLLDLRRPANLLTFRVQTTAEMAMREYWLEDGFIEIHSPKLMATASESGAELFQIPYFDTTAYLAQSPQFYKQMAMCAGFERVFEIAPVFRANPSFTSRHDTEFTSVDVEISWIQSHEDLLQFEERWLQYVIARVVEAHGSEIEEVFGVQLKVPTVPFPRMPMAEAIAVVTSRGHTFPPERKGDLDPQGERMLGEYVKETYDHEFVFVTDYPITVRPFYHMRDEGDPPTTRSYDLLWKGMEITTGAQREHRPDVLAAQAEACGVGVESIQFYIDFFKYGCPPHGGFGFGLTRMLMVMLEIANVREVTYVYRGPKRLHP